MIGQMEEFFTREKANNGIELPLVRPDGEPTEHTITVLGIESDEYQKVMTGIKRGFIRIEAKAKAIEDEAERLEYIENEQHENELLVLAALVGGWTFEQELTHENKVKFLREAPQIAESINKAACSRKLFFPKG